jgi:TetR/AcrR family transcriptional regulator, transcriptional repressor for nem operon
VQEVYDTHPAIREACNRSISGHAATLLADIEEAVRQRGMRPEWTAESLALYTQATLQGAFILAKARSGAATAAQCIDHLRRYIELLFQSSLRSAPPRRSRISARAPKRRRRTK